MGLADAVVHSAGVDWASVAVIATAVLAIVGAFVTWIGNKITHAINDMSESLQGKLETKENVAAINVRVARIEQTLFDIRERQINEHGAHSGTEYRNPGDTGSDHGPG